ncbi:MAG: CvpA family protein [Cyclobacteriaceae bacterium]|nr:CvpA family protein [Cyclobacteriaceae bacterium]
MSILDIFLIIFFGSGMVSGYRKGFLVSLFSLLAIFFGILLGFKLMGIVMLALEDRYDINEKVLPYVAFGVVFIIVSIGVNLLGKALKSSLEKTLLGSADQWAGSVLGLFRTIFMVSILVWILDALSIHLPERWTENSWLFPFTSNFAPQVLHWFGELFPTFKDILQDYTS